MTARKPDQDRMRFPKAVRTLQIVDAAAEVIRKKGVHAMTLDDVAHAVGITRAGIINCVGSKDQLFALVLERCHDQQGAIMGYLSPFEPGGKREGDRPSLTELCRVAVRENDADPEMLLLFHMLGAETNAQDSPGHRYFARRRAHEHHAAEQIPWDVPDGVSGYDMFLVAMQAMYGMEHQWLNGQLEGTLVEEWSRAEKILFPLPLWEGRV